MTTSPDSTLSAVAASYAARDLRERLEQLIAPGDAPLTPRELAGLDQFHTGGIDATARVAALLRLERGARIIDLGSGLGGPARYFASEHGLVVHGIDLTPAFVDAARYLTERCGITGVDFAQGDVTQLDAPDAAFDGAVMMHVAMNVHDRAKLYTGIHRVLRPGAPFVTYDIVGVEGEPAYPMPWAETAEASCLLTAGETSAALAAAGFDVVDWELDRERAVASFQGFDFAKPPPLGAVLGLPTFGERIRNVVEAFNAGRIAVFTAVATSQPSV